MYDIILICLIITLAGILYAIQKQKKLNRLKTITLHDKLMASTLKNPSDGQNYW
jgi:hypothetical protein